MINVHKAADIAVNAKFATSGQDCLAANRIYVERSVLAAFTKAFAARMAALKVGGGPIPFGGWKQSGLGRKGSRHGLEAFTELKYLCIDTAA